MLYKAGDGEMKMRRRCRIWWPEQLLSTEQSAEIMLFGWFVCRSSASLDIVVAFASDQASLVCQSHLQDFLHYTNGKMPKLLRESSALSLLGHCAVLLDRNRGLGTAENDQNKAKARDFSHAESTQSCGCRRLDGLLGQSRQASVQGDNWIQLEYGSSEQNSGRKQLIPRLHHMHWNEKIVSQCDVHVIMYETPMYGMHHFSLAFQNDSPQQVPQKKPKWVHELHQKQSLNDMDNVILAINCSAAAKEVYKRYMHSRSSRVKFPSLRRILVFLLQLFTMFLASVSTLFYVIIQLFHMLSRVGSHKRLHIAMTWVLKTTWINIRIRISQILYWPIFLQDNDLRSLSCVQHAEEAAIRRHSMWSTLAIDVLLGNLIGFGLLFHVESFCMWILNFAKDFTNDILRSGCVWLMGVPAGFKLNTELAGVLGMISLNAIQIWSTLWFCSGSFTIYFAKVLAILGITFGATIPAALVIDIIVFATLHVSILHRMIALLYSQQIQALAALWRLFRGRKWNPLRQRLDSYDYTVKQHVVGSLLFTPLLLLLPTTSVFYIFFSIVNTAINTLCMLIEIIISFIHATPYNKIILWVVNQRRFPSGICFEIITPQCTSPDSSEATCNGESGLPFEDVQRNGEAYPLLASHLQSNFLSLGQILLPHYKEIFSGLSGSSLAASAHGVLTGRRTPYRLGFGLPPAIPWMHIPFKDYWILCHNSILSCMTDGDSH